MSGPGGASDGETPKALAWAFRRTMPVTVAEMIYILHALARAADDSATEMAAEARELAHRLQERGSLE
jgi:hypothetical protein